MLNYTDGTIYAVAGMDNTFTTAAPFNAKNWNMLLGDSSMGSTLQITGKVTITEDYTIYRGTLQIMKGAQVLIPYSSINSTDIEATSKLSTVGTTAYRTLTVGEYANIVVDNGGTLLINAAVFAVQPKEGFAAEFGQLILNGSMIVNGTLYSRGYVRGEGKITAEEYSTTYILFAIGDWRGGSYFLGNMPNRAIPFNNYELNNIQVSCTYKFGSKLIGSLTATVMGNPFHGQISILSDNPNAMFQLMNQNSSVTTICIDEFYTGNGKEIEDSTTFPFSKLNLSLSGKITATNFTIDLMQNNFPSGYYNIPFYMDLTLEVNSTLDMYSKFKFLPGSSVTINKGAVINSLSGHIVPGNTNSPIESGIISAYDANDWVQNYYFTTDLRRPTKDVVINCYGTLNIDLYYTSATETPNITMLGHTTSVLTDINNQWKFNESGVASISDPNGSGNPLPGPPVELTCYKVAFTPIA